MFGIKSETVSFSSQDLQSNRLFIASQNTQKKQKSAGPRVLPKVIRNDRMIYHLLFIFTLAADSKTDLAHKYNL